jgi:beta-glucanase (GH16 family)
MCPATVPEHPRKAEENMMHRKALRSVAAAAAVASVALVALVPGTASAHQSRAAGNGNGLPNIQGYKTVWSDNFNGRAGSPVDPRNWIYDLGQGYGCGSCPAHWGTDEIETMSSSTTNVSLDGQGDLLITPVRHADGSWTSGRIETASDGFAAPTNGILRFQASIQLPQTGAGPEAAGYWPAFWSMGAPFRENGHNGWPGTGEIDVMENINGRGTAFSTLHCGVAPGGPCNEFNGLGVTHDDATLQSTFHTYAMELDKSVSPQEIRFYFDGTLTGTISEATVGSAAWADATDHGFFLILDVAMGGSFPWAECNFFPHPGGCSGSTPYPQVVTSSTVSGVPMKVAYVAVYTKK